MNPRKNMWLVAGGGTCAVLLAISLAFLFRAHAAYRRAGGMLDRQYSRLAGLNTRNPFPSLENIEREKENLDRLESCIGALSARIMEDPFPPEAVEPADFCARAQGRIERFRKQAVQAGIKIPSAFEVGFERYVGGGALPEARHVPRLSRQLYSVEKVVDVLVRCGDVSSIDTLSRDMFETQSDPGPDPRERRRPRRNAASLPDEDIRTVASAVQPPGLYYIERVKVGFTANEAGVWQVLDLFAAAPHFMAVADFAHATRTDILSYNPDAVKRGGESDDETTRFLASGILTGSKALSRPERIIAGNEMVRVVLTVDVYNFNPDAGKGALP